MSVNIVADGASVSSPNPSAHTDSGVTTVRSTSSETTSPHCDFDVGLVLTEFPSTLEIRSAIHRGHQKYPPNFPEDEKIELFQKVY